MLRSGKKREINNVIPTSRAKRKHVEPGKRMTTQAEERKKKKRARGGVSTQKGLTTIQKISMSEKKKKRISPVQAIHWHHGKKMSKTNFKYPFPKTPIGAPNPSGPSKAPVKTSGKKKRNKNKDNQGEPGESKEFGTAGTRGLGLQTKTVQGFTARIRPGGQRKKEKKNRGKGD